MADKIGNSLDSNLHLGLSPTRGQKFQAGPFARVKCKKIAQCCKRFFKCCQSGQSGLGHQAIIKSTGKSLEPTFCQFKHYFYDGHGVKDKA